MDQTEQERLKNEWAKAHGGLTETSGRICARRLLPGKNCLVNREHLNGQGQCGCPGCGEHLTPGYPTWDHPSLWLKDGKPWTLVLQPYGFKEDELKAWTQSLGLRYKVFPPDSRAAWYYPEACWLIVIMATPPEDEGWSWEESQQCRQ